MIDEFKFGFFKIDGKHFYDDIKIVDGKIRQWSTRERHELKLADLNDIIKTNPEIIIVGQGATGLLQVPEGLKMDLRSKSIKLLVDKTPQACEAYNKAIAEKKKVAAILHATC